MTDRRNSAGNDEDRLSFSLSDEGGEDTADSLNIKPPQAVVLKRKTTRHKKDKISRDLKTTYRKGHSSRSEDRRKDYNKERSQHDREVHRRTQHREKRDRQRTREDGREYSGSRKDGAREERVVSIRPAKETQSYDKSESDQLLDDLRGRLLEKRGMRDRLNEPEPEKKKQKKEKRDREKVDEFAAETEKERDERLQREERKAKLLEAEREMALRKEVSRRELEARRERHNLEKQKHKIMREIAKKNQMERDLEDAFENEDGELVEKSEEEEEEEEVEDEDEEVDEVEPEPEIEPKAEEVDNESADSSSTSSSSSSGTTDQEDTDDEGKAGTPESVPPLEKSPSSPEGRRLSRESSRELSVERSIDRDHSEDLEALDSEKESVLKPVEPPEKKLPNYYPAIQGCRSVEEFQCLNRIEEGTYGVVYRARDKKSLDVVALKRLKMEKEKDGFPITSLREINTLLKAQHPNIVTVREIVVGSNMDKIFIVMDYVEHDLKSLMETMKIKKQVFVPGEIKCLMLQLLRAVAHLHDNWILHRDLKTSNLLLSHKGVLKVGDFGLAREYGSPLKAYTPIVVTLWYRAPELLLQTKEYSIPIDIWSVGCIFGELLQMDALFPGRSEMDQLNKIFKELGTPNEKIWPGCSNLPAFQKVKFADYSVNHLRGRFGTMISDLGIKLVNSFLTYDPTQRITAEDALKHDYFKEAPLPIDPAMFPTWPAKSEQGAKKVNNSPKPPSGGREYKQLGDTDDVPSFGFHMGVVERRANAIAPGFSLKF